MKETMTSTRPGLCVMVSSSACSRSGDNRLTVRTPLAYAFSTSLAPLRRDFNLKSCSHTLQDLEMFLRSR